MFSKWLTNLGRDAPQGREGTMSAMHPWKALMYVNDDKELPVILGKGGQLSATIAFAGHDLRSAPDMDLMKAANAHIQILSEYAKEEGFVFHDDLTSMQSEYLRAPWFSGRDDEVTMIENDNAAPMVKLLSSQRKERHARLVEPVIFKTITFQPPKKTLRTLDAIINGTVEVKDPMGCLDTVIREFNEHVENITQRYTQLLGNAKRLNADQLYSYCYYTLTGLWCEMKAPRKSGAPFDKLFLVKRKDDKRENTFSVRLPDGQSVHIRVLTMYGMPEQIRPEFFEGLAFLGAGIRWSTRLVLMPQDSLATVYRQQIKRWKDSTQTWFQRWREDSDGVSDHDPLHLEMAHKAVDDLRETRGSLFGAKLVSNIIVYRTTAEEADAEARNIARYLSNLGKPCEIEEYGSKVSMAVTLPGTVKLDFPDDTLGDYPAVTCLPCSLPYTGPDQRGGIGSLKQSVAWQFTINDLMPARVDFGNGQNRHTCITAPVRTGKSTLLQVIITFVLAHTHNPFVFMLDMDMEKSSSNIAARANGGAVISFRGGTAAVQPLRDVHIPERKRAAARWIQQCIRAHGLDDKHPIIIRDIEDALRVLATVAPEHRTMAQFQAFVQNHTVRQCVQPFAHGDFSSHVGGNRNVLGKPPYVVVDCTGLAKGDPLAACVVSALVDEISFTVANHDGPVQLCIDEAVQVFPLIGESIDAAYKRWPKQGGGISVVIHDPKDLMEIGKTGDIIVQNTGAWICLGDKGAELNDAYGTKIRLTDFQRALVAEMKTPGEFMLKVENEVRVIQTDLSMIEKWVLGQTGKEAQALCSRIDLNQDTDDFAVQLLRQGGFHDEATWIEMRNGGGSVGLRLAAE